MSTIDLRSDTVTRPDPAMRQAMAQAEVGDDIYGEDPTARALEARVAELLGKEAALFVPSGTMGNQIALLVHCRPGDDVVVGEDAHCMLYESGAAAAIAGVQFSIAGRGGLFDVPELETALRPPAAFYMPRTRLVALENTHNRGGGVVWPAAQQARVITRAKALGLATHLDGARIWNAAVRDGVSPASLAAGFDTVSVCFSKGLGAPVGSAIVGSRAVIEEARRQRKMLGGAMRQVGVLCAAALHALEHNLGRLAEDHDNARRLAEGLAQLDEVSIEVDRVHTNIVCFDVEDAHGFVERARQAGVLLNAMTSTMVRAVTHLHITREDIDRALAALS